MHKFFFEDACLCTQNLIGHVCIFAWLCTHAHSHMHKLTSILRISGSCSECLRLTVNSRRHS